MDYIAVEVSINPYIKEISEILSALLSELPFESFEDTDNGFKAYIQKDDFNENAMNEAINSIPFEGTSISCISTLIPKVNWNSEWEKNFFNPILIEDKCLIRSTFHKNTPEVPFEIIIDPKMSFGTGHHSTTTLMVKYLLKMDVAGKSVLDMGCGTGILAILAHMNKAKSVTAIDIDEWSVENSIENIELNNTSDIDVKLGGAETIGTHKFDLILANINRNILLNDMHIYQNALNPEGTLIMSGFYEVDLPLIEKEANRLGLKMQSHEVLKDWTAAVFK